MPGYIIHLAEGSLILRLWNNAVSDDFKNQFLIGCLLPDTRLSSKKRFSHFWNKEEMKYLARKPDLSIFLNKYGNQLKDPIVLGYYAHLMLDVVFIDHYWADEFCFTDENGNEEKIWDKVKNVTIKSYGTTLPINRFLSEEYYYGDYSRTNEYYIEKYKIEFPKKIKFTSPISEVKAEDMRIIYNNLEEYCMNGKYEEAFHLKAFNLEKLDGMVYREAEKFVEKMQQIYK